MNKTDLFNKMVQLGVSKQLLNKFNKYVYRNAIYFI